ncbi:TPA: sulfite exporter TauE/SafE family protein [Burkholderia vietnamiensis]|uniref:sulfite exporter TauE/SafE family protein n=1 Tax=Burkholderia vietnamiensis TaxID=60552 RepID=UPI001CF1A0BA|nr:sulfite exporter TauE/SafE family protein [Burkholderia vietnamiensis]MCA8267215.1 sulfite exporter TauE/SafE family protein [Burkholderia vietnamiensis]UKV75009.1 sulfite exporter TauE/SafE family protein [Burkholderia vietnamiensis]HDR8924361.1 sulfite exporter TauE/SafE family protein [Burkholderia vietnamiensis]HDR9212138.1 sulfite exporter TauE/SafE family protein [Burkholderia vietnamiensis]
MLISLVLGGFVGAVLGLTGAGGGILAVPALVVGMGWPMQQATPVALVAVAGSAALGALEGFRRGLVRYRAALLMALAGVPLTTLGVRLAHVLPQRVLLALFALTMLIVAARLLRQALRQGAGEHDESRLCVGRVNPDTGRLVWSWPVGFALASTGAVTGLMTGLLGVGGGFVIVPMLRKFTNVSMHGVVATSLMVIALVGTGGVLATFVAGTRAPLGMMLWFTVATALGMVVGRAASRHLSARHVQAGFAIVLVCVALGLLAKAAFSA